MTEVAVLKRLVLIFVCTGLGILQLALQVGAVAALPSSPAAEKVHFYTLPREGDLVKCDPDTDRLERTPSAGLGYIGPSIEDSSGDLQTRILDVGCRQIVSIVGDVDGPMLIDLQTNGNRQRSNTHRNSQSAV